MARKLVVSLTGDAQAQLRAAVEYRFLTLRHAKWRLAGRAVLAGVVVFASTLLQAPGAWDRSLIEAAAVSALWAAVEVYTPLNALVGKWKPKA